MTYAIKLYAYYQSVYNTIINLTLNIQNMNRYINT